MNMGDLLSSTPAYSFNWDPAALGFSLASTFSETISSSLPINPPSANLCLVENPGPSGLAPPPPDNYPASVALAPIPSADPPQPFLTTNFSPTLATQPLPCSISVSFSDPPETPTITTKLFATSSSQVNA